MTMHATTAQATLAGLEDPALHGADAFRLILDAMARPGTIAELPLPGGTPDGLTGAAFAVALVLADPDVKVYLSPDCDTDETRHNLRFHCGCPLVTDPAAAGFAFLRADEAEDILPRLSIGTPEYPDRSATAVVMVDGFSGKRDAACLTGPGINGERYIQGPPGGAPLWQRMSDNAALYPLGFDTILADGATLMAIPRSTQITLAG